MEEVKFPREDLKKFLKLLLFLLEDTWLKAMHY